MTKLDLLDELPDGFAYPPQFMRAIQLGLTCLEPWWILQGEHLRAQHSGLGARYPLRVLVPFASRQDCDDVACWDLDRGGRVSIVHDFASPGWEQVNELDDFDSWLRVAIEDLIEFGA